MRRMTYRSAVLGVISGMVLAMPAVAVARPDEPRKGGTDCVVQYLDERGEVIKTATEPERAVHGQFRCVGGEWEFAWAPFERADAITASEIQVDPAGNVSVRQFAGPALTGKLTMAEIAGITAALTGEKKLMIDRAVVVVDDGRKRTPKEIEALLAGKDTTGAKVLKVVDRPDPAKTMDDIIADVGTKEPTVVYLSFWGAIKRAIAWVVGVLEEIGEVVRDHCRVVPGPNYGVVFTCEWRFQ